MASSKKGGESFPLNLISDAANIIDATHGGVTAVNPLHSAQDLTQKEQSYAPKGVIKTSLSAENTGLTGIGDVTNTVGHTLGFLTSGKNWIRLGEVVAGVILIVMGLRTLAGHDTTPISVTTGAAKGATKAAMRSVH